MFKVRTLIMKRHRHEARFNACIVGLCAGAPSLTAAIFTGGPAALYIGITVVSAIAFCAKLAWPHNDKQSDRDLANYMLALDEREFLTLLHEFTITKSDVEAATAYLHASGDSGSAEKLTLQYQKSQTSGFLQQF